MAKKSAYGRTTVAEVTRTSGNVRTNQALMSDRTLLIKHTWLKPGGTVDHSTGWKVRGKVKESKLDGWAERRIAEGYERVS
jgi:hypothetical protein